MASALHLSKFVVGRVILVQHNIATELAILNRVFDHAYLFIWIAENPTCDVGKDEEIVTNERIDVCV